METMTKEMAAVLRSTDSMANQFAIQVQQRLGQPVSHAEILAVMTKMSPKQLSMKAVVLRGSSCVVSSFWSGRRDRIGVRLDLWHRFSIR